MMTGPLLFKFAVLCVLYGFVNSGPLEDYVWHDDGYYKYEFLRDFTYRSPDVTTYVLNMTSQKWLSEKEVSRSIWYHYLFIHVPDEIDDDLKTNGYLFIDGDDNSYKPTAQDDVFIELFRLVAKSAKTVTAVLKNVPNARIQFAADPQHREMSDMDILSYTWKLFNESPNRPELSALLPMTKAGVKAMDTVTDFASKNLNMDISTYCVSGASKRGWAAWTTAAVDNKRVVCLTPVVFDYLNLVENFHHHYRAYGGWSWTFSSMVEFNVTGTLDDNSTVVLTSIIDPFAYRDKLTMPKMIVSSTGDEYFLPDDSHYYLNQMKGPTYVNMIPNTEHTLVGHELQLVENLEAFYVSAMKNIPTPQVSWLFANTALGGIIEVTMDTKPLLIRAWHATTPNATRRDFRLLISDPSKPDKGMLRPLLWSSSNVTKVHDLSYKYEMTKPDKGWMAFFIQMTFPQMNGRTFECTTETNIIPNTFPFPDCSGQGCHGTLV